jgi:cobalt-zinc-cadmium efflux system outer membrane protein
MQSGIFTFTRLIIICSVLALLPLLVTPSVFAGSSQTTVLKNLSSFLYHLERQHPRLKASQAELDAAKARSRAAAQPLYNPEIELDAEQVGFNRNRANATTIGLSQTIDWHDKRSARKNIAIIEQQVTKFVQQGTRQQLVADIFSTLADYQLQREIIQSHNRRLSLSKQVLAQANRLYKAGDISKLDLEQIRLSHTRAQLTLNQAQTQLAQKAKSLSAIAAVARKTWPSLPYAPPGLRADKLNYEQILTRLPSLQAEKARVAAARSVMRLRVREQKADPTIGLRAGGEDSSKVIGLTLSIPLNVRNNYRAEVDEARADIHRAESSLENTRHLLKTRLQSAAQTYQLTYSGWKSWQKIAGNSLQQQSHLLMRLWKAGELSTSDYLVQLNQIREAELNNVELKGNVWKAWFDWLAISNQFKQWLNGQIR